MRVWISGSIRSASSIPLRRFISSITWRWVMIDLFGVHGAHDTNVVRDFCNMRKEIRDFLAGLAVLLELNERAPRFQHHVLELGQLLAFGERFGEGLIVNALEFGLEIQA